MTAEPKRARDFYHALFGWESGEASPEFGGYWMFMREGVPIAGARANTTSDATADRWSVHVAVEDVAATLERGRENGGDVVQPVTAIGDLGVSAVLSDQAGASIGLWSSQDFSGFRAIGERNAPRWFELHTRRYDEALSFYRGVFDWDVRTMSDDVALRYSTVHDGESVFAGLMDATGHFRATDPSTWTIYFGVANLDESLDVVLAHGGGVLRSAQDSPYGRVATVRDPSGASFQLMQ
ncbi:MAG TPA: VOC family protein [Acidimicrobiales bacterium]|nr:VOC family protein [Acidimicrobiales bacterium]